MSCDRSASTSWSRFGLCGKRVGFEVGFLFPSSIYSNIVLFRAFVGQNAEVHIPKSMNPRKHLKTCVKLPQKLPNSFWPIYIYIICTYIFAAQASRIWHLCHLRTPARNLRWDSETKRNTPKVATTSKATWLWPQELCLQDVLGSNTSALQVIAQSAPSRCPAWWPQHCWLETDAREQGFWKVKTSKWFFQI